MHTVGADGGERECVGEREWGGGRGAGFEWMVVRWKGTGRGWGRGEGCYGNAF